MPINNKKDINHLHVVLTPEQYRLLSDKARQCGITKRLFIVRLLEGTEVKARPSQEVKALRTEIHHIGNNINQIVSLAPLAGDELAQNNPGFKNLWNVTRTNICKLLGATLSMAGSAFMIYNMVTTGQKEKLSFEDIVLELSMGEVALMSLIKGCEYIMESKLGGWIAGKLANSATSFGRFAEGFSKWFTEEGISTESALARFFGKNSRTFCQRVLGPAMIITAIVLGSLVLEDAIKTGETREIVLDALNLVALTGELVAWGVAMCGFTWAGPMGMAFAVMGGLVLLVQIFWSWISPPKGPVEQYVDNKLVPAGLAAK